MFYHYQFDQIQRYKNQIQRKQNNQYKTRIKCIKHFINQKLQILNHQF